MKYSKMLQNFKIQHSFKHIRKLSANTERPSAEPACEKTVWTSDAQNFQNSSLLQTLKLSPALSKLSFPLQMAQELPSP